MGNMHIVDVICSHTNNMAKEFHYNYYQVNEKITKVETSTDVYFSEIIDIDKIYKEDKYVVK